MIAVTSPFPDAAKKWLDNHRADIKERTANDYLFYIRNLSKFFGDKLLSQITANDVLDYQQQRKTMVGHECVNHEINTLKQIMDNAGLWDAIRRHYHKLKPPQWHPPKVMTAEEEEKFFTVASSKPEWEVALWCCIVSSNTSAIGSELTGLQLRHVFLEENPPKIHINDQRVKNEFRARVIPLNPAAFDAMSNIVKRARRLGAFLPTHYIIPFRVVRNRFDVTRPASRCFIRSSFRAIRTAAGLDWMLHRNFRNQAITKLFERGTPDETVAAIAGHSSVRMSQFYSRIRIEAKSDALNMLGGSPQQDKPKTMKDATRTAAVKLDSAIGVSVSALVEKLKAVGLSSDKILEVITGVGL